MVEARKDLFSRFGLGTELGFLTGSRDDIHSHLSGGPSGFYRSPRVTFRSSLFAVTITAHYRWPVKQDNLYLGIVGIGGYLSRSSEEEVVLNEDLSPTGQTLILRNRGRGVSWQQSITYEMVRGSLHNLCFFISLLSRNGVIREFANDVPQGYDWNRADVRLNGPYLNMGLACRL
jgi:hypothetical protein